MCLLLSCSPKFDDNQPILDLNLSPRFINSDVFIYAPDGWNSHLIGGPVSIMVEIRGKDLVQFSNDYRISIFAKDQDQWIELEKIPTSYTKGDILLRPSDNNPLYYGSTMVEPVIGDISKPVKIRIIVAGYRFIDGKVTDQLVAAYTDIWLFPEE